MAVTYGFFNSVNGDRKYNADQMSEYFRGIVSQGVFQHLDSGMAVSAGTGLSVSVAAGRAIIQNRWVQNSAALNLTISDASETYGRKDAVVIRLDKSSRAISIAVKTGTPAASPVAPEMTRNATTYEMALAYVNVAAGASSVTVTDKRSDSSVCGWAAVAQATSGEVDAQLNAMKTGFDGVVYPSPAAMVQECDKKLDYMIYGHRMITTAYQGSVQNGNTSISNTSVVSTSNRIRSFEIKGEMENMKLPAGTIIRCTFNEGYKGVIGIYSASTGEYIGDGYTFTTNPIYVKLSVDSYVTLIVGKTNDGNITPEEIINADFEVMNDLSTVYSSLVARAEALNKLINKVAYAETLTDEYADFLEAYDLILPKIPTLRLYAFVNTTVTPAVYKPSDQSRSALFRVKPSTTYHIKKEYSKVFRVSTFAVGPVENTPCTSTTADHEASSMTITTGESDTWLMVTYWDIAFSYNDDTIYNSLEVYEE